MYKQELFLLIYTKNVVCVIEESGIPICKTIESDGRRKSNINYNIPIYEPYLPNQKNVLFYNCSIQDCTSVKVQSITQVASPKSGLRYCYLQELEKYTCEPLKYYNYKNIDKLLFLSDNLPNKLFYLIDCLVYSDGGRVCHKEDEVDSHTKLVDIGNVARPNESNVLSQEEFICEQSKGKMINCDYDGYVPYPDGLRPKPAIEVDKNILLKTEEALMCVYSTLAALDSYSAQQDPDQFHIQTDEDDERYFLYQTHNGQYRKERRLKDGSVVGTTGWVGADGFLRLQDYIADGQGYRIYKSKTVYVGENRPIGESLKIAKTAPTDSGYNITPAPAPHPNRGTPRFSTTTQAPIHHSSTQNPSSLYPLVSITPPSQTYSNPSVTPKVEVSPNSIDTSTIYNLKPTVPPITSAEATSSPSPYDYDLSNTNTIDGYYASDSSPQGRYDIFNPNSYRHADDWLRRQNSGIPVGNGYTSQFPGYDGVAFRRNGFRYYLPKQYHEEETHGEDDRTGSFGYVDPFGIRRVIYYNTAPGQGFQIRKNNRYVGHDATPYDPRPVK